MATKTSTATKTTAKTAATEKKVVKAGGAKGARIIEVIREDKKKELTRRQVAQKAEATVGRVGEVVRWLDANGNATEKRLVAHLVAKPAHLRPAAEPKAAPAKKAPAKRTAKAAAKPLPTTEEEFVDEVRDILKG